MSTDVARRWNALVDNKWTVAWNGNVCVIRDKHGYFIASSPNLDAAIDAAIRRTEGK